MILAGWVNHSQQEVLEYLRLENAYTAAVTQPMEPLQEQLYQEIRGRIKVVTNAGGPGILFLAPHWAQRIL